MQGLDSIRFLAALWVLFGHGAAPPRPNPFEDGTWLHLFVHGTQANMFTGPAAVIVFFVISGFCIHYSFARPDARLDVRSFLTRRYVRILIPILVAIPLTSALGQSIWGFQASILWSLIAELIYYTLYPWLRSARLMLGSWRVMIAVAFIAGIAVAATDPTARDYPSFGIALNWLIGLPCWLLGCQLAETFRAGKPTHSSFLTISAWRVSVVAGGTLCSIMRFHSPVGYPWTLNVFAILVALWLRREIWWRQTVGPVRLLEWAGTWSYSLYLLHSAALMLSVTMFKSPYDGFLGWAIQMVVILACCYSFYLLVERPAFTLARRLSAKSPSGATTSLSEG